MAFYLSDSDQSEPKVSLEVLDDRRFKLMTAFLYVDPWATPKGHTGPTPAEAVWPVPGKGEETDLASVPPLLWGWFAPYGRQLLPALLHDHYCANASRAREAGVPGAAAIRAHADLLFRRSLREQRLPFARRWLMWAAVSLDGMLEFAKGVFALCLVGALALTGVVWVLPWLLGGTSGWALAVTLTLVLGPALLAWLLRVSAIEPQAGKPQGRWWALQRAVTVAVLGGYVLPIAAALLAVNGLGVLVLQPSALPVWLWRRARTLIPAIPVPPTAIDAGPLVVADE